MPRPAGRFPRGRRPRHQQRSSHPRPKPGSVPTSPAGSNRDSAEVLRSILLTAAHEPIALERLRQIIHGSLINAVAENLGDDERVLRGGLIATQMLGLAMTRYIWRIEPIASLPDNEVLDYIAPTIQRYLSGPLHDRRP